MTHEADRALTRSDRTRLALVLAALMLLALGATCGACGAPVPKPEHPGRTVAAQWDAVVGIKVECGDGSLHFGSGAIVGSERVLTALHVVAEFRVDEEGVVHHCSEERIVVREVDGDDHDVTVERVSPSGDLAILALDGGRPFADKPAVVGPRPSLGETVCAVARLPSPWRRCGTAQPSDSDTVKVDAVAEHGNSGSVMYDVEGRVVGVVSLQILGEYDQMVGLEGSAVSSYSWLLGE